MKSNTHSIGGAFFLNVSLQARSKYKKYLNYIDKMVFVNVTFKNNTSLMGGAAGIFLADTYKSLMIKFQNCQFISNTAVSGGAIFITPHEIIKYLTEPKINIYFHSCLFISNKATSMKILNERMTSWIRFISQAQGGAISCLSSRLHISKTTMINNFAEFYGGAIFDDNCQINVKNTIIRIDKKMANIPVKGQAIYTKGTHIITNSTIQFERDYAQNTKNSYVWFTGSSAL